MSDPPAPTVSAVVLNYNGRHLLEVVMPSLAAQDYRPLEVTVVDDGSTDDSREYLAELWPEVAVVAIARNGGVAAALNRGVAAARGEFVALLNNDIELEPHWVTQIVAGLLDHPDAASAAGKLRSYHQRERLDGTGDLLTRAMVARPRGRGEPDLGQFDEPGKILAPTAGAALYRVSALAEVGPFDESFHAYFEDVDWGLRAQLAGFESWYFPKAVAYHMGGATTGGDRNPFFYVLHRRNAFGLMIKDMPLPVLRANARVIARWQAGTLVHSARHGTLGLDLRAFAGVLLRAPGWLAARRLIQRARRITPDQLQSLLID